MRAVIQRVRRAEVRVVSESVGSESAVAGSESAIAGSESAIAGSESAIAGSESEVVGSIDEGLVVLVGIADGDSATDAEVLAKKIVGLRVFRDEELRMNRSIAEVGGSVLIVSQFTLYGDIRRGRRPSFSSAADPVLAKPLIERVIEEVGQSVQVESGSFGAMMEVDLVNDGPMTIIVEIEGGRVV